MEKDRNEDEPELRWIETPKGRATINAVSLTVLLAITQHFGYIAPGPPVTLENIILYGIYGVVVGLLMYVWTDFRLRRRRKKLEAAKNNPLKDKLDDE
tara:strand:+ start:152 stop:445 length:294 start_codon:yes stop_codon:yes gene_type:complete